MGKHICGAVLAAALAVIAPAVLYAQDAALAEGAKLTLTRDAVLNGVKLEKGSEIKIVAVQRDENENPVRVDIEQVGGDRKLFRAITMDAVEAMTGSRSRVIPKLTKGSQIQLMRAIELKRIKLANAAVLVVDKVYKDAAGRIVKVDMSETTGEKRKVMGVAQDELLLALSPDDITWPDAVVGAVIVLPRELVIGATAFSKGTKLQVTKVVPAKDGRGAVKVGLIEVGGRNRNVDEVSVAVLKAGGALGGPGSPGKSR